MDVEMMRPNKIGMNGEYSLKSIGDHEGIQCAEIVIDFKVALNADPASDSINGGETLAQSGLTLQEGSLKGTIWFDPALGFTRESLMTADLKFKSKDPWRNDMDILEKLDFHTKLEAVKDLVWSHFRRVWLARHERLAAFPGRLGFFPPRAHMPVAPIGRLSPHSAVSPRGNG